jgi:hypothetical protein
VYLVNVTSRTQPEISKFLKTTKHWHLYYVYSDPDFISRINKLKNPPSGSDRIDSDWRVPYQKLAEEFSINYIDVYRFKMHGMNALLIGVGIIGSGIVMRHKDIDAIQVTLKKDITQKEYYALWGKIKEVQTKVLKVRPTKRKAPDEHQLIYAVYRARKRGLTFRKIFSEYQNGNLDLYFNMPTQKFSSEDDLEKYYRLYRPDK